MKHPFATVLAVFVVALLAFPVVVAQQADQAEVQLKAAITKETVEGDLKAAIELYRKVAQSGNRPVAAKALIRMGQCYEKLGDTEARKAYERVVREFADQKEAVEQARALLAAGDRVPRPAGGVSEQQVWVLSENPLPYPRHPSLDGRYIPYTDIGSNRVKLRDLTTGDSRIVVDLERGFAVGSPAMSPDSKQIAYTRYRRPPMTGTDFELRVSGIDGSGMKVLVSQQNTSIQPLAWSPDGRHILARIGNSSVGVSLALVPVAGGSARVLTTGGEDSNGCFSPDGKHIVTYPAMPQGSMGPRPPGGFKLRPIDGGREVPLLESPARNWAPFWAPDGRHLVFLSDRSGATGLWSIPLRNALPDGEPRLLKPSSGLMEPLGFTRDGSFYYNTSFISEQDVYVADTDPATGRVLSKLERISRRAVGRSGLGVAWSPDGEVLAYTRETPENLGRISWTTASIVLRSDRTGEERDVLPVPPFVREYSVTHLDWFAGGHSLLARVLDNAWRSRFFEIDVKTGQVKALPDLKAVSDRAAYPSLSRDGKTFFYTESDDPGADKQRVTRLMRRNLETGETRELHRSTSYIESLSVSPDGRELLFQGSYPDLNTMSLLIIPVDGGAIRELYRSKEWMSAHIWTSDGRRVLFSPVSKSNQQPLLSIPVEGGEPQPTGLSLRIMYTLALRPDGRRIAIAAGGEGVPGEVWVIRNLLPAATAPRR